MATVDGFKLEYTAPELAKMLDVCVNTIKNRIVSGEIRAFKRGNRWVIPLTSLRSLAEHWESMLLQKNLEKARHAKPKETRDDSEQTSND
jgi:hypothetical protein